MNKIDRMSARQLLLLSVLLAIAVSACSEIKTASDAPNATDNSGKVSTADNAKATQDDAQSETRRQQLNADIRAREQRNNMGGDPQKRTEGEHGKLI